MPICRLHFTFPRTFFLPTLLASLLVFANGSARAEEPCRASIPLDLGQRTYAHVAESGSTWFTLEAPPAGWLLIEAQAMASAERRPALRIYDKECQLILPHSGPTPLEGRWINELTTRAPAYVEIAARGPSRELWIDAWTATESLLASKSPRRTVFKNGEDEGDPDPIPDEPIDEWEELRTGPIHLVEIPAWGLLAGTELAVSWCPWALEPRLLGTLTCARTVQLDADGPGRFELNRLSAGGPDWVRLELSRPGTLSLTDDLESRFFDRHGRPISSEPTRGSLVEVAAGPVFLWLAPSEPSIENRLVTVIVQLD